MNAKSIVLLVLTLLMSIPNAQAKDNAMNPTTVPIILDHNRMLFDGEIQRNDGTWRTVRFWVDTGNQNFLIGVDLARDLGIEIPDTLDKMPNGRFEAAPLSSVRIGGTTLDFGNIPTQVWSRPKYLFNTMHIEANFPSTVLQRYDILFDYPGKKMTLAQPGTMKFKGVRAPAAVNRETGIVQIDALVDSDTLSFALDNGAAYSFMSVERLAQLLAGHTNWPQMTGAVGCANIWGWWPEEQNWSVARLPEILWGGVRLEDVGMVGLPQSFPLPVWYSQKTAKPVDGLLGPNAFKAFRVGIDYVNSAVYFEKTAEFDKHDLDIVGLTLQPQVDGGYKVIGVARYEGKPSVVGVEPGDVLQQVGNLKVVGATMGTVIDAMRGKPGDTRTLVLDRNGQQIKVEAKVVHFM
jgi:hypothetical protein